LRVLADEQVDCTGAVVGDSVGLGGYKADIEEESLSDKKEEAAHLWSRTG
jgi:hypothetical protein